MPFPTTPLLDDFNRGSLGPQWESWKQAPMTIISDQFAPTDVLGDALWAGEMPADVESYLEVPVLPVAAGWVEVNARMDPGPVNGYAVRWYVDPGSIDYFQLVRWDNWGIAELGVWTPTMAAGDAVGIQCWGTTIRAYARMTGEWVKLGEAVDATYNVPGRMGMIHYGNSATSARFDNYGGGPIPTGNVVVPMRVV